MSININKMKLYITYIVVIQMLYLVLKVVPGINYLVNIVWLPIFFAIWFFLSILQKKLIVKPWMIAGLVWLLYIFYIGYGLNDTASRSRFLVEGALIFFMVIGSYLLSNHKFHELSQIGKLAIWGILITIVYSYFILKINPMIARDTASGSAGTLGIGVAGYDYIYGLVTLIPMLVLKIIDSSKHKDKKTKALVFILLLASVLYILKSQFTIAFILTIFGIILGLFASKESTVKNKIFKGLLMIVLLILFLNIVNFLHLLIGLIPSAIFAERINEVIYVINTNDLMLSDRLSRMITTYNTFLQYPLGAVFKGARFLSNTYGVDFHTEWLNVMAYYGVQGLALFILWIVLFLKDIAGQIKQVMSPTYIYVQFFMIFLIGLLNPIHFGAIFYFISFFTSIAITFVGYKDSDIDSSEGL